MRILALVPGGISEQLLFFPALEDIKKAYPDAEIGVVVDPRAKRAYRVSKIVDTVVPFTFSGKNSPSDWANLLGTVRDREYEVVISADPQWGTGFMLWLSGIPTRIAYDSTATPYFYTATVPDTSSDKTQYRAQQYRSLLSAIAKDGSTSDSSGSDSSGPLVNPKINLPEGDLAWANELRDRLQLQNGYVLLYPGPEGHGDKSISYPTASWLALIQDFKEKQPQIPVVLLQTDHSIKQVNDLRNEDTQLTVATAENLGQSAAIIAGASLVITPDSYIMQLSVALKVFTLALFGKHQPSEMLPPITGEETRFLGIASSSPNIEDIAPETVLKKVWGN
ncbi:MAG: glycosyltransferase family 9 protein [Cyanobacteria bacterium P01_F01_bin.3]